MSGSDQGGGAAWHSMPIFDQIMTETWEYDGSLDDHPHVAVFRDGWHVAEGCFHDSDQDGVETTRSRETRAAVAVLGKRALAMVLKYEWNEFRVCTACSSLHPDGGPDGKPWPFSSGSCPPRLGHADDCWVGRIIAEVRKLRGEPCSQP